MKKFQMFIIEPEFFDHYYHKATILYDFLNQCSNDPYDELLQKQFQFITSEIPYQTIFNYLSSTTSLKIHRNDYQVEIHNANIRIFIDLTVKEWKVYCASIHEAERFLFDPLRKLQYSFFVINVEEEQYGWLSPLRKEIIL